MARKVYFSFHYRNDIHRVARIRNSGVMSEEGQPFIDKAEWEKLKQSGDLRIQRWIDEQMNGTSVLILCIGSETYKRRWVEYEIKKAYSENRGILGIHLNGMKDLQGNAVVKGVNPLDYIYTNIYQTTRLSSIFKTYSWNDDDGYHNIEKWINQAALAVGR
ncbi:MAG TPA: TIR-like domain-containing protein [Bacteroidetes bacterium]|nr:TIR-like domain-containing protein [Bacteroidota bacterium]